MELVEVGDPLGDVMGEITGDMTPFVICVCCSTGKLGDVDEGG
jgi:hypothetical protein